MMKLGIISDPHGEIDELNSALRLLEQQGVDDVICAGDLAEKGPDSNAVIRCIQDNHIPCVLGNHDENVIRATPAARLIKRLPFVRVERISQPSVVYLLSLPLLQRFTFAGKRILLTHATPRSNREFLFPRSSRRAFERVIRDSAADYLIVGHTHIPMHVTLNGTTVYNAGSVCGAAAWGSRTCAILTLPDGVFQLYDLHTAAPMDLKQITL